MAKSKVFLTVLVVLLAGCAVLLGCAGEGAGSNNGGTVTNEMNTITDPDPGVQNNDNDVSEPPVDVPKPEIPNVLVLDEGIKRQIQQQLWNDWLPTATGLDREYVESGRLTMENKFPIPRYYGTYNGYVVITATGISPMAVMWGEVIDGIVFSETMRVLVRWNGRTFYNIFCWKDHALYTMTELYEQGELTREDLLTIKENHWNRDWNE